MMKRSLIFTILVLVLDVAAHAQGMHFSQYYNSPMLLNPANTALMSETDYRVGANYRSQWAKLPVPYKTISGFADFQVLRNRNMTNWLGLGLAFYNDQAGDGKLTLTRTEAFIAYHVQMGETSMISAGISGAYGNRSVDYSAFTFDQQWNGFNFDKNLANGEEYTHIQTSYYDVSAGVNYAYFPNEAFYLKIGVGLAHLNQPQESFYNITNTLKMRPTANIDALLRMRTGVLLNPSVYYTTQSGANEIVYGVNGSFFLGGKGKSATDLILGIYHRWDESVIGLFGLQWGGLKFTTSYDFTMGDQDLQSQSGGAIEFAIIYQGMYGQGGRRRGTINCPRF